jgi:hypothetical protein
MAVLLILVFGIISLASLGGGIYCLVRYARTRRRWLLVAGVALTFILPGICITLMLGVAPDTTVVYGPPPARPSPVP